MMKLTNCASMRLFYFIFHSNKYEVTDIRFLPSNTDFFIISSLMIYFRSRNIWKTSRNSYLTLQFFGVISGHERLFHCFCSALISHNILNDPIHKSALLSYNVTVALRVLVQGFAMSYVWSAFEVLGFWRVLNSFFYKYIMLAYAD